MRKPKIFVWSSWSIFPPFRWICYFCSLVFTPLSGESAIRMKSNSSSECKPKVFPFLAFCCHKENLTELSPTPEPHPYNRHVTSNPASCINSRDIRCLPAFSQEASGERRNKSQAFRPWARPSVWSPTLLLFWTFQFKSKNIIAIMPPRMLAL